MKYSFKIGDLVVWQNADTVRIVSMTKRKAKVVDSNGYTSNVFLCDLKRPRD